MVELEYFSSLRGTKENISLPLAVILTNQSHCLLQLHHLTSTTAMIYGAHVHTTGTVCVQHRQTLFTQTRDADAH